MGSYGLVHPRFNLFFFTFYTIKSTNTTDCLQPSSDMAAQVQIPMPAKEPNTKLNAACNDCAAMFEFATRTLSQRDPPEDFSLPLTCDLRNRLEDNARSSSCHMCVLIAQGLRGAVGEAESEDSAAPFTLLIPSSSSEKSVPLYLSDKDLIPVAQIANCRPNNSGLPCRLACS